MVTRAVILLAVVAVASSASVGGRVKCCGPTQWEALAVASAAYGHEAASSNSMSGRLSVDHKHKVAALYLMSMGDASNTTMVISANDSSLYVYFIVQRHRQAQEDQQPQPQCVAYVLKSIMSDLSSSCFPVQQTSIADRMKSQAPMNVLTYEYAGLAGLFVIQIAVDANDCSPSMLRMSTGASNGPQLTVMLSSLKSGSSDQSDDSMLQDACSQVAPINIMVPDNGRFGNRRSSMDSIRSSSDSNAQQWIADMTMMYIVQMIRPHVAPRSTRDLKAVLALQNMESQPNVAEVMKSAMALKLMMQNMSNFMGSINMSANMDDAITWMITRDLISALMSRRSDDDSRDDDDDSIDADDIMSWMMKQKLMSSRQKPDSSDALYAMIKQRLMSSMMPDGGHDDDSDDHSSDENDGSNTFNIVVNENVISSTDSISTDDNNLQAFIAWMIKQKLAPRATPVTSNQEHDSQRNQLLAMMERMKTESQSNHDGSRMSDLLAWVMKKNVMSSMMPEQSRKDGSRRHKRDLRDLMAVMNKESQPSHDDSRDDGHRNDDSISMDDIIAWMIKQEIMSSMMNDNGRKNSPKLDLWNVMAIMNKNSKPSHDDSRDDGRNSRDDGRDDHRDDESISMDDIIAWMIKQEIVSSMMNDNGRKNNPKPDLWNVMAIMNKNSKPSHDDSRDDGRNSRDDDNRDEDSSDIDDLLASMIKQSLVSSRKSD